MKLLFVLLLLCTWLTIADDKAEEVNYLELASLMIKDGHLQRAELALSEVNLEEEGVNVQKFHVLTGLLAVKLNDNERAKNAFLLAKRQGPVDAVIDVYLAQAAFALEDFQLALDALDSAGESIARISSVYHMRAQCHWKLEQYPKALAVMDQAGLIFPEDGSFPRRKIFYLIELGLNKEAAEKGKQYLKEHQGSSEDYVAIGNALRSSGDLESALEFLEFAKLKFSGDVSVAKTLAGTYIKKGNFSAAAKLIHEASLLNPELLSEAAELYRRSGELHMALTLNARIKNQEVKFKQRMGLLIELENYDQAAAMEMDLLRTRVIEDQNIKYALAYAYFKTNDYSQADHYISQLTDTELFKKGVELRRIIEECSDNIWLCQ